jgi:hypothetical protein
MDMTDGASVAAYADEHLPLATASLGDAYYYASVPLCLIDAVYSIGVRFEGVEAVVRRYCDRFGLPRLRPDRLALPPRADQESVSAFCARFEHHGVDKMTEEVFDNRQRTSTKSGILKADAVYRFAAALRKHGIEFLQDVPGASGSTPLEKDIHDIPGQRSGISLQYFLMLAGSDQFVKPDRMIIRFLQAALDRPVAVAEAQGLLSRAAERLKEKYPQLTPRSSLMPASARPG